MFRKKPSLSKEDLLSYASCIRNLTALCHKSFSSRFQKAKDTLEQEVGFLEIEVSMASKFGDTIPENLISPYKKTLKNIQIGYELIENDMREAFTVVSMFLSIFRDVNRIEKLIINDQISSKNAFSELAEIELRMKKLQEYDETNALI